MILSFLRLCPNYICPISQDTVFQLEFQTARTMSTTPDPDTLPVVEGGVKTNASLESLQTNEQRRILDTVSQIRKCGLDRVLSLPQIVVCGDQSAGKSSLLEALTEIPFPRNDNLCTRFATEISLRREPDSSLTIRIIPDGSRPQNMQSTMRGFSETITDFKDLPAITEKAMEVMGISSTDSTGGAFARDTLSIEILGPDQPHLTLVDIPGLIQTSTKGVSEADVAMVAEITDSYIKQPRTICLAVVSATNDAANQPILQRVRKVDPQGEVSSRLFFHFPRGYSSDLIKEDSGGGYQARSTERRVRLGSQIPRARTQRGRLFQARLACYKEQKV